MRKKEEGSERRIHHSARLPQDISETESRKQDAEGNEKGIYPLFEGS